MCIWLGWASASTCIYCYPHCTTPLSASLHSHCYTSEALAFSAPHDAILHISVGDFFEELLFLCFCEVLVECMYQQGVEVWWIRGEFFSFCRGVTHLHLLRMHVFLCEVLSTSSGELSLSGWAFEKCVLLVVLIHLSLSRGTRYDFSFVTVFCSDLALISG